VSAFDALTAIPSEITAGEAVAWTEDLADYPGASYAVAYRFAGQTPQDGFQQFAITGTETSTATYTFTTLTTYKPGTYNWQKVVTRSSDSVVRVIDEGTLTIKASLSATPTTTTAASMVTAIKTALATLAASTNETVDFNGQRFTRRNQQGLQSQLVYWEAQVLREQSKIDALSGKAKSHMIGVRFV
jgi:hypothetical protein